MGRYLIAQLNTSGVGGVEFQDSSTVTVSNSTVPQVLKTWTLDQSDAYWIIVTAQFRITSTASSTVQAVNPTITIGSNTRTFPFNTKASADDDYVTITYGAESRAGDVVTAQLNGSAGTDANTSVTCKTFVIEEISP